MNVRSSRHVTRARRRTRRWAGPLAATVAALMVATVAPVAARSAPPDSAQEPAQELEASIRLPLRFPLDPTYATWPGGQRQAYTAVNSNGDVGYVFELAEGIDGGTFELEVLSGATGREDLDIAFYKSFSPVVSTAIISQRRTGGESGPIPKESRFAIVTMFDGADAVFRFTGFEGTSEEETLPAVPETPGIYDDFGKSNGRSAAELRRRSHVVIALVDTGVNPYHQAFRRNDHVVHPSRYIEGFPDDVPALGLSFGQEDYVAARGNDDPDVWSKVQERKLYWIPGTNVIGAYSVSDYRGSPPGGLPSRPIVDDDGHGTGVASVSSGAGYSYTSQAPYGSNPEALIVVVEGLGTAGVKWASEQPWIDFISGSYGDSLAVPYNDRTPVDPPIGGREYRYTGPFSLRDGRTACFSAGNGLTRTGVAYDRYSSLRPTSGPSWVVTVGAVSPRNGQDYGWHSEPVDVSSYGLHWPAADPFTLEGEQSFGGTSNATPVTCGVFSKALLEARRALGDTGEGVHAVPNGRAVPAGTSVPATGPPRPGSGLVADGVLTRQELHDAVFKTAFPEGFDATRWTYDPVIVPHSPAYYTQEGYGIANVASAARAVDVILGRAAMPDRSDVDAWIGTIDSVRDELWPPEQHGG